MPLLLELSRGAHRSTPTTLLFPILSSLLEELKSKVVIAGECLPAQEGYLPCEKRSPHPSPFELNQRLISQSSPKSVNEVGPKAGIHLLCCSGLKSLGHDSGLRGRGQCSVFSSGEVRAVTALNHNLNTFCTSLPVSCFLVTKMMILHWGLLESQKIKDCNSIFLPLPQKVIQPLKCWKRLRGHYLSLGCSKRAEQAAHPKDNVKSSTRNQGIPICFSVYFVAVQIISAD